MINVGFAKVNTALGDKKKAIKNWEIVLEVMPDRIDHQAYLPRYELALEKLKEN